MLQWHYYMSLTAYCTVPSRDPCCISLLNTDTTDMPLYEEDRCEQWTEMMAEFHLLDSYWRQTPRGTDVATLMLSWKQTNQFSCWCAVLLPRCTRRTSIWPSCIQRASPRPWTLPWKETPPLLGRQAALLLLWPLLQPGALPHQICHR